ncbi:MAG TPA: TetR/AcrR family transcriptional regulator [Solirubrobacteraceae bacterium]|jgi:AcrR family transcriptional regulator|nr:TetR/AcrR family transcriptional regulator [Solirubrobacteraceae bacterium]
MPREPVKDRLLEAAIGCLQRQGYAATTARDIAAEAGANLRSIGYHYGSTRGLLLAAISANWRRWLAPLIAAASSDSRSPEERLVEGMELFSAALSENAPMVHAWLEAVTLAPRDAELRATLAANQQEFRTALAANLAAAGQPDADARADAIITVCDGLIVHFLLYEEVHRPRDVAREASAALAQFGE